MGRPPARRRSSASTASPRTAGRFDRLAERLGDAWHVVAVDLRGHGRSTWEPPWTLEHAPRRPARHAARARAGARGLGRAQLRRPARAGADRATAGASSTAPSCSTRASGCRRMSRSRARRRPASTARTRRSEDAVDAPLRREPLSAAPRVSSLEDGGGVHLAQGEDGRLALPLLPGAPSIAAFSELADASASRSRRCSSRRSSCRGAESDVVPEVARRRAARRHRRPAGRRSCPAATSSMWEALEQTASAVERFLGSRVA